ncbi:MAG: hypothetical protein AAF602_24200 [Myxococcota bacterium]
MTVESRCASVEAFFDIESGYSLASFAGGASWTLTPPFTLAISFVRPQSVVRPRANILQGMVLFVP